jgi:hypothetical protein
MAIFPTFGNKTLPSFFAGNDTPFNNSSALLGVGLGLLSGKNAQDQVGQAAANFANNRTDAKTYNKTLQYLQQNNPDLAEAVSSGAMGPGDAFKLAYQQKLKADHPAQFQSLADGTYGFADPDTQQFTPLGKAAKPVGPGGGEYGLQPIWTRDAQGNPVLFQPGKDGSVNQMKFPDGITPTPTVTGVDLGTSIQGRDKFGNPVYSQPKDLTGAANLTGLGKSQAEAATALLPAQQIAGQIDQQIAELKADPSLPDVLGPIDSRTPNFRSGPIRAQAKIDQLKGGSFLSARQMLKGGGPITDFEGKKADAAVARMEQAQDVKDFNDALDDFNDAVQSGVQKLQMQAQGNFGVGASAPSGGPATTAPAGAAGIRKYNPATGRIE